TVFVNNVNDSVGPVESQGVFVVGEVKNKGFYRVKDGYTALKAVYDAGGFTKFAAPTRVKLFRKSGEKKEEYTLDLKAVEKKGDKDKDMVVKPGDIINVPRSRF